MTEGIGLLTPLFEFDSKSDKNTLRTKEFQGEVESSVPRNKEEAKELLLKSIDIQTGTIKDFKSLVKVFEYADSYINESWDLLPEETKKLLVERAEFLLYSLSLSSGNKDYSKVSRLLVAFFKKPIRNFRNLVILLQKPLGLAAVIKALDEEIKRFANSIQRLQQRSFIDESQAKLTQSFDDSKEQLQKNQEAILGSLLDEVKTSSLSENSELMQQPQRSEVLVESTFIELAEQWRRETYTVSSTTKLTRHPAYQQIISMGDAAIPLLLKELERKPAQWFMALKTISGEDPVPPEFRGRTQEMIKAWLEWGRSKGYKW